MKKAGIGLIIVGLLITVLAGATFVTKKKVVDIGKLEITKDEEHRVPWTPIAGGIVIIAGIAMVVAGGVKGNT